MPNKKLSGEAEWFLKSLQTLQDDFAESIGAQIVTTDKEGNLITKMSGQMKVCSDFIQKTEKGKKACTDTYHTAVGLVKTMKEPAFMDCFAGYASLWVPIKTREGEIVGSITGCGGRFDRGESEEQLKEKFTKLANDLDINPDKNYLKAAVEDVKTVTEEEMRKRATMLAKLAGILAEETALSEAFGIKGREW